MIMFFLRFFARLISAAALGAAISLMYPSCAFIHSFDEDEEPAVLLSLDKDKAALLTGEMDVINLSASASQNSARIVWEYDHDVISAKTDNYSAVITGLKPGTATLTARCGSSSASCVVTVSAESYEVTVTNPYVYATHDYVDVQPNSTVKVSASLFGGTAGDIDGFTWSIDKPSVASLATEGNYCWITGGNDGIAKVTVKHQKATYGYSLLVNCASDGTTATYITTENNIITMNMSESDTASFSVDLKNPAVKDFASAFSFCVVDELGNPMPDSPAIIEGASGLSVSLRARRAGNCMVRCSHPNAAYSLDVLVRVIENAETGFIEPSESVLVVGSEPKELSLSLNGYSGDEDITAYGWSFSDGWENLIDCEILNGGEAGKGNKAYIKGKRTGSVRITLTYPGLASRSVIILVRNLESAAADSTTYITTSQSYIRMGKDSGEQGVSVTLRNCAQGDSSWLEWRVRNVASDGSKSDVIRWKTGSGTSSATYDVPASSRSVVISEYSENAYAVIEPVRAGTAYIEISHPKAVYKTTITVVVTEKAAAEAPYITLAGSPLIMLRNGTAGEACVKVGSGEESQVAWRITDGLATAVPNGKVCAVSAPAEGSGVTRSRLVASLGESSVTFTVMGYDTEEEKESIKFACIWSDDTVRRVTAGDEIVLGILCQGDVEASKISWDIVSGGEFVSLDSGPDRYSRSLLAVKGGRAQVRASYPDSDDVVFTVTVTDKGIEDPVAECYLSTGNNVVFLEQNGDRKDISVEPHNISESVWGDMRWECTSTLFEVSANGSHATVTALADDAEAVLRVSHPLSENEIEINLRSGNRYVYVNEDTPFVSVDKDVLELYAGQEEVAVYATLNHTAESEPSGVVKGFSFTSTDPAVASVSYVNYSNCCYVRPLKNGTCKVIITHPDSAFEKEVVVVVRHAADATSVPYITTESNVITLIQGDYATPKATLMNSGSLDSTAWHWKSQDDKIAAVVANNGTSAMLSANRPGTTVLKVTHDDAPYALSIIVVVLDASAASSRPHISVSDNILNISKDSSATFTASLIGGRSQSDANYFKFYSSDSSVIIVTGASGSASVRGVRAGMAYVTVSNSRYPDSYSRTVLVVVEDTNEKGVYIKPSQSIIKIRPDDRSLSTVTAELVGGEATDGQDFIWWADDYSLIGISSVADSCSVQSVGRSGTTKVHVKHAKAEKTCDILILVSKYDQFAFSQTSAEISSEKLYFYPMQVPALETGCKVRYSTSNPDVCLVEGSDSVAWVCGLDNGTASLTATLLAEDGRTVIATAEMLVTVTVPVHPLPVISVGNSILTVEKGTSQTFAAVISGEGVDATEKYNLKWSVKDAKEGISFLNEAAGKTAYGSDCYMTFDEAGEYVVSVSHERSGAVTDLYIIVEDKGVITIELNSSLETVYKDDGTFTLTAKLTNAKPADYKEIEWSAVKVGGANIVSVSKAKGETCTVTPKSVGTTSVIARLPSGQYAKCLVIVKASAEITLETGIVRVVPGYTEIVNYTTNPTNATVNWYTQMTNTTGELSITNYFSIEDDPVKRQLRITGIKDLPGAVAGTVTATLVGASSGNLPKISVYCEYDVEVDVLDMQMNNCTIVENKRPDTSNTKDFYIKYWPTDIDIDISYKGNRIACFTDANADNLAAKTHKVTAWDKATGGLLEIGSMSKTTMFEGGVEKVLMRVTIVPHSEGEGEVTVTATLPKDSSGSFSKSREFYYSAYYDHYDIVLDMDKSHEGAFTAWRNNELHLSDGEEAVFSARIKQENARGKITGMKWEVGSSGSYLRGYSEQPRTEVPQGNRAELCQALFGNKEFWKIGPAGAGCQPQGSLLSLTSETAENGQTMWHFRHNWDYYQDVGYDVNGNWFDLTDMETWKNYYGPLKQYEEAEANEPANIIKNGKRYKIKWTRNGPGGSYERYKDQQFDPNFWNNLNACHVEDFLVLYEPLMDFWGQSGCFIRRAPAKGGKDFVQVKAGWKEDAVTYTCHEVKHGVGPWKWYEQVKSRYTCQNLYLGPSNIGAGPGCALGSIEPLFYARSSRWYHELSVTYNDGVKYKKCNVPYVVSLSYLSGLKFFHPDYQGKKSLTYEPRYLDTLVHGRNPRDLRNRVDYWDEGCNDWGVADADAGVFFSYAALYATPLNNVDYKFKKEGELVVVPTISKNTNKTEICRGSLIVSYVNGGGMTETDRNKTRAISVVIESRPCEAYTNGEWETDSLNSHVKYMKGTKPHDYAITPRPANTFSLKRNSVRTNTYDRDWKVGYVVQPAGKTVTVTIPKEEHKNDMGQIYWTEPGIKVKNGTLVSSTNNELSYQVPTSGTEGFIDFDCTGNYQGRIVATAQVNGKPFALYVDMDVKAVPLYVLDDMTCNREFSYNEKERMLKFLTNDKGWNDWHMTFSVKPKENFSNARLVDVLFIPHNVKGYAQEEVVYEGMTRREDLGYEKSQGVDCSRITDGPETVSDEWKSAGWSDAAKIGDNFPDRWRDFDSTFKKDKILSAVTEDKDFTEFWGKRCDGIKVTFDIGTKGDWVDNGMSLPYHYSDYRAVYSPKMEAGETAGRLLIKYTLGETEGTDGENQKPVYYYQEVFVWAYCR